MSEYHPNLDGPAEPYALSIDGNGNPLSAPVAGSGPLIAESDWESLVTLLYGAWEDEGLIHEQEVKLAQMRREPEEYSQDAIARVEERVDWMRNFYQRVVFPHHQAQNDKLSDREGGAS